MYVNIKIQFGPCGAFSCLSLVWYLIRQARVVWKSTTAVAPTTDKKIFEILSHSCSILLILTTIRNVL